MAFYAKDFIFDGTPSEFYNVQLGELDGAGVASTAASSDVSLLTQKLFRRSVPLFWGAEQTPVLSFPLSVMSPDEITPDTFSEISGWLFGKMNYKELRICQNDMIDMYFNAFLTAPQIVRVGNTIRGFTTTAVCDSPWGWRESRTRVYNYTSHFTTAYIPFPNWSADNFYTYPTEVIITANMFGGSVSITNTTDSNSRVFVLNLLPNEVVTLDCSHQFISSTLVTYPLYNFNQNWLRFIRGINNLTVAGNIEELEITSPVAVKIGG